MPDVSMCKTCLADAGAGAAACLAPPCHLPPMHPSQPPHMHCPALNAIDDELMKRPAAGGRFASTAAMDRPGTAGWPRRSRARHWRPSKRPGLRCQWWQRQRRTATCAPTARTQGPRPAKTLLLPAVCIMHILHPSPCFDGITLPRQCWQMQGRHNCSRLIMP